MNKTPNICLEDVQKICKDLHLNSFYAHVETLQADPTSLEEPPLTWIHGALEAEKAQRESNSLKRRLKEADLRHKDADVSNFLFNPTRGITRATVKSLSTCDWIKSKQNCIITGKSGVGKTWLASALAHQACIQGMKVKMERVPLLVDRFKFHLRTGSSLEEFLRSYRRYDLLILDDWAITQLDHPTRTMLNELVDKSLGETSIMITSAPPICAWAAWIGDATIADAILDRLLQNAIKIDLKGDSLRTGAK